MHWLRVLKAPGMQNGEKEDDRGFAGQQPTCREAQGKEEDEEEGSGGGEGEGKEAEEKEEMKEEEKEKTQRKTIEKQRRRVIVIYVDRNIRRYFN